MPTAVRRLEPTGPTGPEVEWFIDKPEVGRRLNASQRTVEQWMREGLLPYYKIGNLVRFRWNEVEAHLRQNCRVVPGEATHP